MAQEKGGGFYATAPGGASDLIVRGDIAVRQGELAAFGPGRRVRFSDGAEGEFDRVVFATGYAGFKETVAETLGPHAAEQLGSVWGLDAEGEVNGIARFAGIPRAFLAVGNFMTSRTLSKCIALQIVAQRDGNWGEPCGCLAAGGADCRPGAPRRVERSAASAAADMPRPSRRKQRLCRAIQSRSGRAEGAKAQAGWSGWVLAPPG